MEPMTSSGQSNMKRWRDNSGVIVVADRHEGWIKLINERNETEILLTPLHAAVLLDGMLQKGLDHADPS